MNAQKFVASSEIKISFNRVFLEANSPTVTVGMTNFTVSLFKCVLHALIYVKQRVSFLHLVYRTSYTDWFNCILIPLAIIIIFALS